MQTSGWRKFDNLIVPRLFEEKRRDIVFGIPSFRPSVLPSVLPSVFPSFRPPNVVGTLCAQLLLQFCADCFETFTDVLVMVWRYACGLDIVLKLVLSLFSRKLNLVIFSAFLLSKSIDSGYLVCATPPTVLCRFFFKLYRCFCHGLKICMWSGYSPQMFCHFFPQIELSHFFGIFAKSQ